MNKHKKSNKGATQIIKNSFNTFNEALENLDNSLVLHKSGRTALIENYINGNICFHVHFVVKVPGELNPGNYCAFIKVSTKLNTPRSHSNNFTNKSDSCLDSHSTADVQLTMFVNDVHFMQEAQNGFVTAYPNVVRLQSLNNFDCLLSKPPDFIKTTTRGGVAIFFRWKKSSFSSKTGNSVFSRGLPCSSSVSS